MRENVMLQFYPNARLQIVNFDNLYFPCLLVAARVNYEQLRDGKLHERRFHEQHSSLQRELAKE